MRRRIGAKLGRWGMLAVLALGVALAGCAWDRPLTRAEEPLVAADVRLDEILAHLDRRYRAVESLRALTRVQVVASGKHYDFHGLLLFRQPGDIRFKGIDFLGRTLFDLVARHEEIRVYLPQDGRILYDDFAASLLEEWGVALKVRDLLELVGTAGGLVLDPAYVFALEKGRGHYLVYWFVPEGGQATLFRKLYVEPTRFLIEKEEVFTPFGDRQATLFFGDYRRIGETWLPYRIRSQTPEGLSVEILYSEAILNPGLAESDFAFRREIRGKGDRP